jgi:hypothetical protein
MILPMQGFERMDGELLDAAVGQLVPAGSMFAFLAAHRAEVFPDADYADLFAPPRVGRPIACSPRKAISQPSEGARLQASDPSENAASPTWKTLRHTAGRGCAGRPPERIVVSRRLLYCAAAERVKDKSPERCPQFHVRRVVG